MRVLVALPLVVAAACGDNLPGPLDPATGADQTGATVTDVTARYRPEICDAQTFGTVQLPAKDSEVRAVRNGSDTALFMVPRNGGMVRGVIVDGRGNVVGNPAGQKIRTDLPFTSLAASRIDDRFVLGLVAGGQTHVTVVRDDLLDYREIGVADGTLVGDSALMHARGARMAATGGSAGMVATAFDTAWREMGSEVVASSVPTSMSSSQYGTDAMIVWSTDSECHLRRVSSQIESMQPYPCKNSRLAVDFADRGGWMLYERGGSVLIARIEAAGHNMIANENVLTPYGSSPRIAFDGANYWASYIDPHGDVIVGIIDHTGHLMSTAIGGTRPAAYGYDLVVSPNLASIYAVDTGAVTATQICNAKQ